MRFLMSMLSPGMRTGINPRSNAALGDDFDDNFRLWYNDNADHGHPGIGRSGTWSVTPTGLYNQALRFLSAWVDDGIPPPSSTVYEVSDSQVVLPKSAVEQSQRERWIERWNWRAGGL